MAKNPAQELIWQGRIQIGDEPGVYSDASYSGLATELPMTLFPMDPATSGKVTLVLETDGVQTFQGYRGHLIVITRYEPDPAQQYHWKEQELYRTRLVSADNNRKEVELDLAANAGPIYVSVRLKVDTEVTPGLYDDFVFVRISLVSPDHTHYASLGFKNV